MPKQPQGGFVDQPFIETTQETPVIVIISGDPLIAENLAEFLSHDSLKVIVLDPFSGSGDSVTLFHRQPLVSLEEITRLSPHYVIYVHGEFLLSHHLLESLPHYCSTNQTRFLGIFPYSYNLGKVHTHFLQFGNTFDFRLVRLLHPFGLPYSTDATNPLTQLYSQLYQPQITLPFPGNYLIYPTAAQDLISGIAKALFSHQSHRLYLLSSVETIKFTDVVSKIDTLFYDLHGRHLAFNFTSTKLIDTPDQQQIIDTQVELNWQPRLPLDQSLNLSLKPLPQPKSIQESPSPPTAKQVVRRKWLHLKRLSRFFALMLLPLLIILLLSISPLLSYHYAQTAASSLQTAIIDLEQGRVEQAKTNSQLAQINFDRSRSYLSLTNSQFFFLPIDSYYTKYDRLLDVASSLSGVVLTSTHAVTKGQQLYHYVLNPDSQSSLTEISRSLQTDIQSLHQDLSLLLPSLKKLDLDSRLSFVTDIKRVETKVPDLLDRLELGLSLLSILPQTLGEGSTRTYLVLLQNNAELRPTGGFIGSYALISFANGKLTNLSVEDVYSADGQLGGHVEPPAPIKKYLGPHWYMRDSNWHPDFPTSSQQVQWFFEKETGRKVDGVIGIDLFTLKSILEASGPITLSDLNETITADNLFERAEYRSEVNFFPGSTQKRDFLTALTLTLLNKLKAGDIPLAPLARALSESLSSTNITISLNQPQLASLLEDKNWTGSLQNLTCPINFQDSNCTGQTFALIEANLGLNKTNYFLKRKINHTVIVDKVGKIKHNIAVQYQNLSPSSTWPGGTYRTHTRLYVPVNTKLDTITFAGKPLAPAAVTSLSKIGLQEISLDYEIDPQKSAELTFQLVSNQVLAVSQPLSSLSLNWQKQSGTDSDPLTVTVDYPSFLLPTLLSLPGQTQTGKLTFTLPFTKDYSFAAKFRHE